MTQKSNSIDVMLALTIIALIAVGILMIVSTSPIIGFTNFKDSFYFIKKHLIYLALGVIALVIGYVVPISNYKKWVLPGFVFANILVALTLVPAIGMTIGGASRWLNIGIMSVQPVEIVKFFTIVFLSVALSNKRERLQSFTQGLLPIFILLMIPLGLLFKQPDLGNIILIILVAMSMLFLSDMKIKHFLAIIVSAISFVSVSIMMNPYQLDRIKTFLDPWTDPYGKTYHIIQSFIAIGSGGLFGSGIGEGKLKYFYLPLQYSDFVYSIVCEEGGLFLGCTVIILFCILLFKGVSQAQRQETLFGAYLSLGLTFLLVFQALLNIGVVIGVLPVTGIPLTFISFGGTSLITSMYFSGILIQLSKPTSTIEESDSDDDFID